MERRDVFRLALRSGAVATVVRLSDAPATASDLEAAPKVEFQKGTLNGGKFTGWEALLAITGRSVRGTIFDPRSIGDTGFIGYRVRGTARGKVLDLDLYDLDDLAFGKPVGGGKGKDKGRKTTTNFEVDGGPLAGKQEGSMTSRGVPLSSRSARQLAGTYAVRILEAETEVVRAEFRLVTSANGKFAIDGVSQNGIARLQTVVAGRFGVARDGTIFTTMLIPPPGEVDYNFVPSEVNLMVPRKAPGNRVEGIGEGVFVGCILYDFCYMVAQEEEVLLGTLSGTVTDAANGRPLSEVEIQAGGLTTTTDGRGRYGFRLQEGSYRLIASKRGYRTRSIENVEVTLIRAAQRDFTLAASPAFTASGRVLGFNTSGNAVPLPGATVRVTSTTVQGAEEFEATSGKNGAYSLQLQEDTYAVRASKDGYEERAVEAELSNSRRTIPEITLPLLPRVRFFGRVLSRPRPDDVINVDNAQVSLHDWDTDELRYTQNTGVANERFDFPDVLAGHYRIRIAAGGYFHPFTGELVIERTTNQDIYLDYVHRNFRDDDFPQGTWQLFKVIDTSEGNNSIVSVTRLPTGGVDESPYRRYHARQPLGTTVGGLHLRLDAVYNPSFGAIRSVQFIADLRSFVGQTNDVSYCLALRQGDTVFATDTVLVPHPTGWDGRNETGVTADRLWDVATHTRHPVFGANGAPITFGYLVRTTHPTNESGLDTWRINLDTEIAD